MLKLLLVSAAIIPVAVIPWMNSQAKQTKSPAPAVFSAPATDQAADCADADISVFFHDLYITSSSAEYIFDGMRAYSNCSDVAFKIVPLIPENADKDDIKAALEQADELQDYMALTGLDVPVAEKLIEDDYNSGKSGRAAILRIKTQADTDQ